MKRILLGFLLVLGATYAHSKTLIAYFSWSGNTEGIAREIYNQLGTENADLFVIEPKVAYSDDYETVLQQAQKDQHKQARPVLKNKVENFEKYESIILGYPNWWASIPMPIATFLESYDFTGKDIYPFCSHGGGRFGQSISAISKLAPKARVKKGLSIHYSGGSSLQQDVAEWLKKMK